LLEPRGRDAMRSLTPLLVCGVLLVGSHTRAGDAPASAAAPEKWTVSYDTGSDARHRGKATFKDFWILPADGKYLFTTTIQRTGYIEEGGSPVLQATVVTERTGDKVTLSWRWTDEANGATSWVHTDTFVTLSANDFQGVVVSENEPGQFAVTGHRG
jgi:hypothetical protein